MPRPYKLIDDLVSRSSQNWSRYMTTRGLTEHIGTSVSHFHLYVAKEDPDNAADYVENTYMNADDIRAISIWVQTNNTSVRIITRNSNPNNEPTHFRQISTTLLTMNTLQAQRKISLG